MIKSQDVLTLLKLVSLGPSKWSYGTLSNDLAMSSSQLHSAVKRAMAVNLMIKKNGFIQPNIRNLEEFLIHAVKYMFVAEKKEITRGIPTAHSAPLLNSLLTISPDELPLVWPDPNGKIRGTGFTPIHKYAPLAGKKDPKLYDMLTLVDAIRDGRAREREIAVKELIKRLQDYK